ncbi:MAG: hypothetical protein WBQ86_21950 [Candidatus Binatus sp.]
MADPFHIGPLEAVYKVIEERVPFGRQITTITSVLIVFGIIVFVAQFLVASLMFPLGGAIPSIASFLRRVPLFGPDWTGIPPEIQRALFYQFTLLFCMYLLLVAGVYLGRWIQADRNTAIEKRVDSLENAVGIRQPQ